MSQNFWLDNGTFNCYCRLTGIEHSRNEELLSETTIVILVHGYKFRSGANGSGQEIDSKLPTFCPFACYLDLILSRGIVRN